MRDSEREAGTQAEGEAGSVHGAGPRGTQSRDPGSRPGPKAGAKPLSHSGVPIITLFSKAIYLFNT